MAQQGIVHRVSAGRRDPVIDTLRGIACLLLVGLHVIGHNDTAGIRVSDDSPYRYFTESLMYIRMPLFSFLARWVYATRPLASVFGYSGFMKKKGLRLLVPYAVFVPLIGIAQSIVPDANNPTALAWWQWFIYPLSPYWFLIATFWIFAVVAIADAQGWLDRKYLTMAVIVLVGVVDVLVPAQNRTYEFLGLRSSLFLLTFFLAGLAAQRFDWRGTRLRNKIIVAALTTGLIVVTQLGLQEILPRVSNRHELVGTLLGVGACLTLVAIGWRNAFLGWIGLYSAGIFLIHPFAIAGTRAVLKRLGVDSTEVLFLAGLAVGIFGSILAVQLLRRVGIGRFILGEPFRTRRPQEPLLAKA